MDTPTSTPVDLEQAKAYIGNIDFSNIINKMVDHMGWRRNDALTVCAMYRNYLFLHKKYGDQYKIPPSEDMDEFWHLHILDTRQYQKDCQEIFGKYLDHYPYLGIDEETNFDDLNKLFETTKRLYLEEFKTPIQVVRHKGTVGFLIRTLTSLDAAITKLFTITKYKTKTA